MAATHQADELWKVISGGVWLSLQRVLGLGACGRGLGGWGLWGQLPWPGPGQGSPAPEMCIHRVRGCPPRQVNLADVASSWPSNTKIQD